MIRDAGSPLLFALACRGLGASPSPPAPSPPTAFKAPLATKAPLLALARIGPRLVAVGDYGVILLSDDAGATWRQAELGRHAQHADRGDLRRRQARLGRRATAATVLHTADGGENWALQYAAGGDVALLSRLVREREPRHRGRRVRPRDRDERRRPHVERNWPSAKATTAIATSTASSPSPAGRCSSPPRPAPCSGRPTTAKTWATLRLPYAGSVWGGMPLRDGSRDRLRHARPRAAHARIRAARGPRCRPAPTSRSPAGCSLPTARSCWSAWAASSRAAATAAAASNRPSVRSGRTTLPSRAGAPGRLVLAGLTGVTASSLRPMRRCEPRTSSAGKLPRSSAGRSEVRPPPLAEGRECLRAPRPCRRSCRRPGSRPRAPPRASARAPPRESRPR